MLIDFNSDEGEAMRNAQLRELRVLNGTPCCSRTTLTPYPLPLTPYPLPQPQP